MLYQVSITVVVEAENEAAAMERASVVSGGGMNVNESYCLQIERVDEDSLAQLSQSSGTLH